MRNLLFDIAFIGTHYHGWQVQTNAVTVQQTVQDAVERLFGKRLDVVGCSRTDAGVHAKQFTFNLYTEKKYPCDRIRAAMNRLLPSDISVKEVTEVPLDFHARYHCAGKEYVYQLWTAPYPNPFVQDTAYHYPYPLRWEWIEPAMHCFLGTHDFTSMSSIRSDVEDKTRTMTRVEGKVDGHLVCFYVQGDGFLYNMVRIMVGTLLFVSQGKIHPEDVATILAAKDRSLAGKTAPAHGLCLNRVFYP